MHGTTNIKLMSLPSTPNMEAAFSPEPLPLDHKASYTTGYLYSYHHKNLEP
jgi:hypothetical protein